MNRAEVAATPSSAAPASRAPDNRWAVLALVGVAQLMIVLDVTIVNIALPSAQVALHFSTDDRQWIITAYALVFGSLLLLGGKLGDLLGRKWTFMAGLLGFAGASALGGLAPSLGVLIGGGQRPRPRIDFAGVAAASGGFFCLVYGFSNAETHSWSAGLTIALFAAGAVLLASFVLVERRATHPLLPLRIVTDRSRGGAYASIAIGGAALFSVSLFMTYYIQQILHFSPVKTGLAFLPLTGAIIIVAPLVQTKILPRLGPRPVITFGMTLGVIAMIIFTRLTPGGSYAAHVLPGLVLAGAGTACVVSASFATGTLGVRHTDAGIASAVINTSQQIGGSIGTALLSAIFAGSLAGYLASHPGAAHPAAVATVHAYTVGFTAGAVIFAIGLLLALVLLPSQRAIRARMAVAGASSESNESRESLAQARRERASGQPEAGAAVPSDRRAPERPASRPSRVQALQIERNVPVHYVVDCDRHRLLNRDASSGRDGGIRPG
jgi:predicted MFS family arabinose efflux permease